jgi:hypothetical protein
MPISTIKAKARAGSQEQEGNKPVCTEGVTIKIMRSTSRGTLGFIENTTMDWMYMVKGCMFHAWCQIGHQRLSTCQMCVLKLMKL